MPADLLHVSPSRIRLKDCKVLKRPVWAQIWDGGAVGLSQSAIASRAASFLTEFYGVPITQSELPNASNGRISDGWPAKAWTTDCRKSMKAATSASARLNPVRLSRHHPFSILALRLQIDEPPEPTIVPDQQPWCRRDIRLRRGHLIGGKVIAAVTRQLAWAL